MDFKGDSRRSRTSPRALRAMEVNLTAGTRISSKGCAPTPYYWRIKVLKSLDPWVQCRRCGYDKERRGPTPALLPFDDSFGPVLPGCTAYAGGGCARNARKSPFVGIAAVDLIPATLRFATSFAVPERLIEVKAFKPDKNRAQSSVHVDRQLCNSLSPSACNPSMTGLGHWKQP